MALLNTQELVERSISRAIKAVAVAEGYSVDVSAHIGNTSSYEAAMVAIAAIKNFAVEVFGHGSSQRKGIKRVPRIVVNPQRMLVGDLGNLPGNTITADPLNLGSFLSSVQDSNTMDLSLEITLTSSSAEQDRILHAILSKAIGTRRYLPLYNDPSQRFLIKQFGFYDVPDTPEGIIEKTYNYQVPDLIIAEYSSVEPAPVPIREITLETNLVPGNIPIPTSSVEPPEVIQDDDLTKTLIP